MAAACFESLRDNVGMDRPRPKKKANPWGEHLTPDTSHASQQTARCGNAHKDAAAVVKYGEDEKAMGVHRMLIDKKGFVEKSMVTHKPTGVHHPKEEEAEEDEEEEEEEEEDEEGRVLVKA